MPANLTPEFEKAEQRYREAKTDEERLKALRLMLATIPKHKGTEKMQAEIKRKISLLKKAAAKKSGPAHGPDPFQLPRCGLPRAILIGSPNVGKSSLLSVTTHAPAKIGNYPYTTQVPQPGIWEWNRARIELVDTPPVDEGHIPSGLLGTIRSSDLICLVVDGAGDPLSQLEMMIQLLSDRGLVLRSLPRDQWVEDPQRDKPTVIAVNRLDLAGPEVVPTLEELFGGQWKFCGVSAVTGEGLEAWFQTMWTLLAMIRVFSKEPGKEPDRERPFLLPRGATVADLAEEIHRDLARSMRFARIWGNGHFPGQMVPREEVLQDGDVVEIHE